VSPPDHLCGGTRRRDRTVRCFGAPAPMLNIVGGCVGTVPNGMSAAGRLAEDVDPNENVGIA